MLRSIDEVAKQRRRQDADDGIFDDSSVGSADDGSSEEDEVLFDKGQSVEVLDSASSRWERATVEKVVNKSCSSGLIHAAVEAHDREAGGGCFDGCPSRRLHPLRPAPRGV